MERSQLNPWIRALSIVMGAAPFGFALIRAIRTGHDLRYVWVALVAFCGAAGIMVMARPYRGKPNTAFAVSAAVFMAATLLAVLAAVLLGTRLGPGILVVGSSFGFCFAVGCFLHMLAE